MIKRYKIEEDITLRDYLEKTDLSKNLITLITSSNGSFIVNDMHVDKSYHLKKDDILEIVIPVTNIGQNIKSIYHDFKIVYEDSYLLIIDKEPNLSTIPTIKHFDNSLANFVASYYKRLGILANIHFVNRLDAKTSGLIILAKNMYINEMMKKTKIIKKYLLEVEGIINNDQGIIETGIARESQDTIKRSVNFNNINSKTSYQVLKRNIDTTIVLATLHTGKTHQLRVHFNYLNHPIVGDDLYNENTIKNTNLHLHSHYLEFIHPVTSKTIILKTFPTWLNSSVYEELGQQDHNQLLR